MILLNIYIRMDGSTGITLEEVEGEGASELAGDFLAGRNCWGGAVRWQHKGFIGGFEERRWLSGPGRASPAG